MAFNIFPEKLRERIRISSEKREQREQEELRENKRKEEAPQKVQEALLVKGGKTSSGPRSVQAPSTVHEELENILEEGLQDIYVSLSPEDQKKFREKGEEVASQLEIMIVNLKVTVKKILALVREWLRTIPGVNRFFLEQEVKIKADQIMAIARKEKAKKRYV